MLAAIPGSLKSKGKDKLTHNEPVTMEDLKKF